MGLQQVADGFDAIIQIAAKPELQSQDQAVWARNGFAGQARLLHKDFHPGRLEPLHVLRGAIQLSVGDFPKTVNAGREG